MGLGVKHPLLEVQLVFVTKEEVKVFERFPKEKGLHHIFGSEVQRVPDIAYRRVPVFHFRVLLDALQSSLET